MLYRETIVQAQVLSYADDFWLLLLASCVVLLLVPVIRRVPAEPARRASGRPEPPARPGLPAPADSSG